MHRKLMTIAVLVATAGILAAVASAGPVAAKQRIEIQVSGKGSFALIPLTPGAVKRDKGQATFCCWANHSVTRDGESIDINNPQMTLTGKRGTLVARNQIGFVDLANGLAVFTGTWKIIRGTGDYAGLAGGGRGAGVTLDGSSGTSQFEGFLGLAE